MSIVVISFKVCHYSLVAGPLVNGVAAIGGHISNRIEGGLIRGCRVVITMDQSHRNRPGNTQGIRHSTPETHHAGHGRTVAGVPLFLQSAPR